MSGRVLTVKEFAVLYGLNLRTAQQMAQRGRVQAWKIGLGTKCTQWRVVDPGWKQTPVFFAQDHIDRFQLNILRGVEVADILGVTPRAVRYMAQRGDLGKVRASGSTRSPRRYSIAEVRTMIGIRGSKAKRPKASFKRQAIIDWAKANLKELLDNQQAI